MQRKQITLRLPEELVAELQQISLKTILSLRDLILLAILNSSYKSLKLHK